MAQNFVPMIDEDDEVIDQAQNIQHELRRCYQRLDTWQEDAMRFGKRGR